MNVTDLYTVPTFEPPQNANIGGSGGTAGGSSPQVFTNNPYGGGTPTDIPSSGNGVARDPSNGQVWWYTGGAWTV